MATRPAISAQTISGGETFVTPGVTGTVNAAQAARRIYALGIPSGSSTALAPLNTIALSVSQAPTSDTVLPFASVAGLATGLAVTGAGIAPGTTLSSLSTSANTVTLSAPVVSAVAAGAIIVFTPAYSAAMSKLVQDWLAFPTAAAGAISSQSYAPGDDDALFWPSEAMLEPQAFLDLALCALTGGYIIPAPFSTALGSEILTYLTTITSPPTIATLAQVTQAQWTTLFKANPTWLPPQPGGIGAQINAFMEALRSFFPVSAGGPVSMITIATSAATAGGGKVLTFSPNADATVQPGWSVTCALTTSSGQPVIPIGTQVASGGVTGTTVTLTTAVLAAIPALTAITFRPTVTGAAAAASTISGPVNDPLLACLNGYKLHHSSYSFGQRISSPSDLAAAAAAVFSSDPAAQAWLVQAFTTIDALCAIATAAGVTVTSTTGQGPLAGALGFSIVEALYSCGFTSAADIIALSEADFAQAVVGTPAFAVASAIYTAAGGKASLPPPPTPGFHPINPDGTLTDSIAPPCLSPLGLVAYLSDLLKLSQSSTLEDPFPSSPGTTLGQAVATRRGPLTNLAASAANLETPLPLIDLVNECLEFMGGAATPSAGTVHDTAQDKLAGFALCQTDDCPPQDKADPCHDPARIFAALPEHATPANPTAANSTIEPAVYETLKSDFSAPILPYSQALDVSRSIFRHLGSCRFEAMRSFRRCITEFVLAPAQDPLHFDDQVWRYPVRIDIAIEYLGITPEEYALLFQGTPLPRCGTTDVRDPVLGNTPPTTNVPGTTLAPQPGGSAAAQTAATTAVAQTASPVNTLQTLGLVQTADEAALGTLPLPVILRGLGLNYCEFVALWQSGIVTFGSRPTSTGEPGDRTVDTELGTFPECEPCCLDKLSIAFPAELRLEIGLLRLVVFVRLWRKLREHGCCGHTFDQLRDICEVLQLFTATGLNPEFIRQLAAFQMLRDDLQLPLAEGPPAPGAVGVARTPLLALWSTPQPPQFTWAVRQLVTGIVRQARRRHGHEKSGAELVDRLVSELDALSRLCGFDPSSAADSWHAAPNHTLRFAEILGKLVASRFEPRDVRYLFTADPLPDSASPFPLQEVHEALARPLELPEHRHEFSLLELRRKLLEVRVPEEELEHWNWRRAAAELHTGFGFAEADILSLGEHFFPRVLEQTGIHVPTADTRFTTPLAASATSASTWNTPPNGHFHYDPGAGMLWTTVPLGDAAVLAKLAGSHTFSAAEQTALQDLYFQPRAMLSCFGLLFADFPAAIRAMVEAHQEEERWHYFRHSVVLCWRRRRIIAEHLDRHVASIAGAQGQGGEDVALLILRSLYADENMLAPTASHPNPSWENQDGTHPPVQWTAPNGGALAGLLALVGTGLVAEYAVAGGGTVWRDPSAALDGFGRMRDSTNCPVPTVLPALNASVPPAQSGFVSARNGLLFANGSNTDLGGAQGFTVTWTGALLIDREGHYEFFAGAPRGQGEKPDFDAEPGAAWRVTLERGARSWVLSSRDWPKQEDRRFASVALRPGAYDLTIELTQPGPDFTNAAAARPRQTGLELAYAGPDGDDRCIPIPHSRLIPVLKDKPLGDGLTGLSSGATNYLSTLYVGSLRDIRRTYQRAFKALMFARRFALHGPGHEGQPSELGYMLGHGANFAGTGFARVGTSFAYQDADFDFNYLPVLDDYHPPTTDQRANPSPQRVWAIFDWWERIFDYGMLREQARRRDGRPWRLFEAAADHPPADLGSLLREIGAPPEHWPLDLRFFRAQGVAPYPVTAADLEDERWTIRAWRADRWLDAMQRSFVARDLSGIRPDLWVADDPAAIAGQDTGNGNLLAFLCRSAFALPEAAPRYEAVRKLNDGLRLRARDALAAYLCAKNRTSLPWGTGLHATAPIELSALLLMDVETGVVERVSRIDEAINAVQTFVRRARLGLEPGWTVSNGFARFWDQEFATFDVWRACRARHLYKENWLEWTELAGARRDDAFRFLEQRLKAGALTVAEPGGDAWWPEERLPEREGLPLAERITPAQIDLLATPREGLGLLATQERAGQPSWLAALGPAAATPPAQGNNPAPSSGGSSGASAQIPLWMQAAIRLGVRFVRLAAAGVPVAAHRFAPNHGGPKGCVTCCESCGREHEPLVDEYYFWLIGGRYYESAPLPAGVQPSESDDGYEFGFQDDYYDGSQQQSAYWQDPTQLPQLLAWESRPMVRLAWCRVHNGEFLQPQRSMFGVAVQSGSTVDLTFSGRTGDWLYFDVSGGVAPQGYADPSPPGFRYDVACDEAVTLPQVAAPAPVTPALGGLPAYPWFVYATPGSPAFPLSPFSPAMAVAHWLRAHCRFEAALRWSRLAFDPLQSDCAWIRCEPAQPAPQPTPTPPPTTTQVQAPQSSVAATTVAAASAVAVPPPAPANPYSACCDSADVPCENAEQRAVLLFYLETLVDWGHALQRRHRSREASQQARVIFDAARMLLGARPASVRMPEPVTPVKVGVFKPEVAPLNPRLLDLYDNVAHQLALIHLGMDARRLPDEGLCAAAPYFGDNPLREGWRTAAEPCIDDGIWCHPPSPYRFIFLIQRALEYSAKAQELGGALLAAFEKGDGEYLGTLRAQHEREILHLGRDGRKDQWREADWQVESLQKTKAVNQANLTYYNNLIAVNLINGELQYQDYVNSALSLRSAANAVEAIGEGLRLIPDFVVGAAGFGGSPVAISWLPLGTKLGDMFAAVARIMNNSAQIDSETAQLDLTEAGWSRRYTEWVHQQTVLTIEIQQMERQILGAQRRRDQTLHELNTHQRQIENSAEVYAFLSNKFTNQDLYLFMQRELAALYYRTYDLALDAARQAERAFNLERGHLTRRFLADCRWDDLREGLTAGEQLSTALRRMEKTYCDENIREYELTKHISLRLSFPFAFLQLRTTGRCEIEIPEWLFDLDFPGQYMRRIRSVTLTLPCVAGPYTGVHCRLTLIDSVTRIDPRLDPPPHGCCCPPPTCETGHECEPDGYRLCPDDPRMVRIYGEREAIATSGGQNDSGLFELSFNDTRYLPFEYMGAVSRWRVELPPENNYFDPDTLTDAVLHLNYTSREGGEPLREAATRAARCKLPGDGWAFFDVRHDFPDAWELMRRPRRDEHHRRALAIHLSRRFLPFLPRDPQIEIDRVVVCFRVERDQEHECPEFEGCPCPEHRMPGWHEVTLRQSQRKGGKDRAPGNHHDEHFLCYADAARPGLYIGMTDLDPCVFRRGSEACHLEFELPAEIGEFAEVYLIFRYAVPAPCCCAPAEAAHAGHATRGRTAALSGAAARLLTKSTP
jgi:hypothetical protein